MATGFSVKLPLTPDAVDGFYKLNKTFGEVAKQNIKMIVLTAPGERMMNPDFGVGIRNYLFDPLGANGNYEKLSTKITDQVSKYAPYVKIRSVNLIPLNEETGIGGMDRNYLGVRINYYIPNLNVSEDLEIKFFND